jgi:hypothetical protein
MPLKLIKVYFCYISLKKDKEGTGGMVQTIKGLLCQLKALS